MTEHDTHVAVTGPTGHRARCRCGWTQDCADATTAVWACWRHVKEHTRGPVTVT